MMFIPFNTLSRDIKVYDTTLRDGEQTPSVAFSHDEKVELAKKSSEFGSFTIDIMPAISEEEKKLAKTLSTMGLSSQINSATMLRKDHIDIAAQCDVQRMILFSSVSDIHLKNKLKITREENIRKSLEHIDYARGYGVKVDFAVEDATRADMNYVLEFMHSVSEKVDYFLPCDTLGILTPFQTYNFIRELKEKTKCKIGMHVHNDFGQATANTLAGLEAGADLFCGTFNGIGERAGNAAMEEVVTALKIQYNVDLNVNYSLISEICSLVENYSGILMQKHKAISGEHAFAHESGIHVDGVLKCPLNYENFDPCLIGSKRKILFGKHSGKAGLKHLFGDKFPDDILTQMLCVIKVESQLQKKAFSEMEVLERFKNFDQILPRNILLG